jgi:hypothetical protein
LPFTGDHEAVVAIKLDCHLRNKQSSRPLLNKKQNGKLSLFGFMSYRISTDTNSRIVLQKMRSKMPHTMKFVLTFHEKNICMKYDIMTPNIVLQFLNHKA